MRKQHTTTTLADCRGTIRRRIQRQFFQSLTPFQSKMFRLAHSPLQFENALARLLATLDF